MAMLRLAKRATEAGVFLPEFLSGRTNHPVCTKAI
jgi:hypothetical protein